MPCLPGHVAGLRPWIERAEQVVVVDSFSTDGTVEYLRERLRHPRLSFVTHPPGLYASWNHGISQITSAYTYLATCGDTITPAGIETLTSAAESLNCDVVISKPWFCAPDGRRLPDIRWPVDDIIESLGVTGPRRLDKLEVLVFAAVHASGALTGSCASCVFRTETLKRFPFPTDCGSSGDGAWGLKHAAELQWGVVRGEFSSFLLHPPDPTTVERSPARQSRRLDQFLGESIAGWVARGTVTQPELNSISWPALWTSAADYFNAKAEFDACRRRAWPWWLHPAGWSARFRRGAALDRVHALKAAALHRLARR